MMAEKINTQKKEDKIARIKEEQNKAEVYAAA
jgi:hypothetical protein